MKTTGGIKQKLLNMAIVATLLFGFGTPAHARSHSWSSNSVDFGNQGVGTTSAPQTITVTNNNRWPMQILNVSLSAPQFSYSGPSLPLTLYRGQSMTATVTFSPTAAQAYSGTLSFSAGRGRLISFALSGTGTSSQTQPATITTQPSSKTIIAGQTATFNVAATGTSPMAYQWRKNGGSISGATSSSYTTPATTTSDNNAQFTVNVSNSAGSATSNAAVLTVNTAVVAPSITTQPSSQTVTAGQAATFNVAASGTSPMTYQWKKNGGAISGATSSSYTTPATTTSDNNAQFTVNVSNSAGSATSNAAVLTVNASVVAPSITTQPSSQTVTAGQAATFNVAASGTSPMTYQWKKNGGAISGATSSSYTTPATTTSDNNAQFTVNVSNSAGTATSNAAVLTVNTAVVAPSITTQPSSQTVTAGQTATFAVAATGTTPMTYQWSKNGAPISGATSSTYTTPATTSSDNATRFNVIVTNGAGSAASASATLTVNSASQTPGCVTSSNTWTNTPLSQAQTGSFRVTFDGTASTSANDSVMGLSSGPAGAYTDLAAIVRFNDTGTIDAMNSRNYTAASMIPYSPGVTYHFIMDVNIAAHTYTASVMIGSVQTVIGSNYVFRAEQANVASLAYLGSLSSLGSSTVCNLALTVNATGVVAPSITTQPSSKTIIAGQTATFNVAATGTSPMTYQWKKNGGAISGATSSSYTTPATTTSDNNAQFTVNVSNSAGSANSNAAVLTVNASVVAPSITTQPSGKTVTAGQTATFSVSATGTSPMAYQWRKNGGAISGATSSSYTTPATTTSDNNAQFTVAVSNSAGSVTSSPATLTVSTTALLLNSSSTSLSFGNVNVSSSSSKNVTLTNAGTSNITISNVTISGAGFNASGVSTGLILSPGQTATLTATFAPSSTGSVNGSVTVASNATNSPSAIALSGTGISAVTHSAALSWTASTSTVMGYNAYRSTQSGGPYTKLTNTPVPSTTYTDTNVTSGTTFYYVVTAVDANSSESDYSTQISAKIP